ncbi:hypothetical protein [Hansschlegelia sp.]|uniref:hypothetical protein n=1 Tax=Hansschlegelia sp. TaxID=2041892 RepID=UPI002B9F29B1|nr:hypothetical protein [Hansschlegelia sp.]HVI28872.1 hypothetical protein [Hansschlegelia sp.]
MTQYVEEFVYRGRPPSSELQPAWHVRLGSETPSAFGGEPTIELTQPMMVTEAEAAGWPLDDILGAVAAAATVRADTLAAQLAAAREAADEAEMLRDQLAQANETIAQLRAQIIDLPPA